MSRHGHRDPPIHLPVAIRAYAEPPPAPAFPRRAEAQPSEWTLIFDTETRSDAGQALRFGCYQLRKGDVLHETGLFYRPEVLRPEEVALLGSYADGNGIKLLTQGEFIRAKFYGIGYDLRATIAGFNLPFDISRVALRHGSARGNMRGGFSFTMTEDKRRPAVRVKHLSRRVSFMKFAAPYQGTTVRSDRKRKRRQPYRAGFFVDVSTLAHALLSRSFSLGSLADHLETETRKGDTDEHGGPLTEEYISYAVQDVQATWECLVSLTARYKDLRLPTPLHKIYSEASIGKAYLDAMGVKPWREVQRDTPPGLIGIIMSTFFGGRSEVRIRRERREVILTDFLSMYPTVCTLMGLWRFVIASGMAWNDDTDRTRAFLNDITLEELRQPATWRDL